MTITIPPELAKRLEERAKQRGTTPEVEAIHAVEAVIDVPNPMTPGEQLVARILAVAVPSALDTTHLTFSREEIYD